MGLKASAARQQVAAHPMRPWVRLSSRTCSRPHRAPVSHSAAVTGAGAAASPVRTCAAALPELHPSTAAGASAGTFPVPAAPHCGATIIPTHAHGVAVIHGTQGPAPLAQHVVTRPREVTVARGAFRESGGRARRAPLHRPAPHGAQAARATWRPAVDQSIAWRRLCHIGGASSLKRQSAPNMIVEPRSFRWRLCVVHTTCPSITWRQWRSACAVNIPRGGNGPSRGQPEEGWHLNLQLHS